MQDDDQKFMQIALNIANRAIGNTASNPAVGCVLVKNSQIIAVGCTASSGRPHAETQALKKAVNTDGATAYVTLEPCCHFGQTPPCAQALIDSGISRVVIATQDPFHKVKGGGILMLKEAGIDVKLDVLQDQAYQQNRGFFSACLKKRPYVTLKLAISEDGMIAKNDGKQLWLTGNIAKNYSHMLRAKNDAIMVGSGTYLADNPKLDCRLPGLEEQSPIRIVMDRTKRVKTNAKILSDSNLQNVLERMVNEGVNNLLLEGGAKLATSFMQENLVDELVVIKAPLKIGVNGLRALSNVNILDVEKDNKYNFKLIKKRYLGADELLIYKNLAS